MSVSEYSVRHFQPADAAVFPRFAELGIIPERVPMPAFTGLADGQVIACAGIVSYPEGVGEAWAALRQPVNGHARWIARSIREFVEDLLASGQYKALFAREGAERLVFERWMRFLGFTLWEPGIYVRRA
jgi:hypothetical protein